LRHAYSLCLLNSSPTRHSLFPTTLGPCAPTNLAKHALESITQAIRTLNHLRTVVVVVLLISFPIYPMFLFISYLLFSVPFISSYRNFAMVQGACCGNLSSESSNQSKNIRNISLSFASFLKFLPLDLVFLFHVRHIHIHHILVRMSNLSKEELQEVRSVQFTAVSCGLVFTTMSTGPEGRPTEARTGFG
jgi:hypothetical protein